MNRFSHSRIHYQQVVSISKSAEANHAGWPDISPKVDLCIANWWCSLARKIVILVIFPNFIFVFPY